MLVYHVSFKYISSIIFIWHRSDFQARPCKIIYKQPEQQAEKVICALRQFLSDLQMFCTKIFIILSSENKNYGTLSGTCSSLQHLLPIPETPQHRASLWEGKSLMCEPVLEQEAWQRYNFEEVRKQIYRKLCWFVPKGKRFESSLFEGGFVPDQGSILKEQED